MGTYGYHLLQDDRAWEILDAVREEFRLPCQIPCGPENEEWKNARNVLDLHGDDILAWILSSSFTRKAAAPFKPYRVVVFGAALLETGADISPNVSARVLREASYLSTVYAGKTAHLVYAMGDLMARMAMHRPGVATKLAETSLDVVVRDAVHDPADPAALANHRRDWWTMARNGDVSFSGQRVLRAALPIESPGPDWKLPEAGNDEELWADVHGFMARRPPFNLRLEPEYSLWADFQALETIRVQGNPGGVALVGLRNRMLEVDALIAPHLAPVAEVEMALYRKPL